MARWLLIADNADTEEAAKAIRDRFPPHLGGHVLVTSRLVRWPVGMAHLPVGLLSSNDAARFLQARVAKESHDAGDETAALALAHELGYLPLALEHAAASILELRCSFAQYQAQLHSARAQKTCKSPTYFEGSRASARLAPALPPATALWYHRRARVQSRSPPQPCS
jgi:hypothetical protein